MNADDQDLVLFDIQDEARPLNGPDLKIKTPGVPSQPLSDSETEDEEELVHNQRPTVNANAPASPEAAESVSSYAGSDLSPEEIDQKKRTGLYTLKRYQQKGFVPSRRLTMDSELVDILAEVDTIKREANLAGSVGIMKRGLTASTYLIETLNRQYNPIGAKLDGWSKQIKEDVDRGDYDEVFEALYDQYATNFDMPPIWRLFSMLFSSALLYHSARMVVDQTLTGEQTHAILRENPAIKQEIVEAAGDIIQKNQKVMKPPSEAFDHVLRDLEIEDENSKLLSTDF